MVHDSEYPIDADARAVGTVLAATRRSDIRVRCVSRKSGLGEIVSSGPARLPETGSRGAMLVTAPWEHGEAAGGPEPTHDAHGVVIATALATCGKDPRVRPVPAECAGTKGDEILAFIAAWAACPDLTPQRVARRTGVSRTVLYSLLKPLGGVATVVQQQRLRMMFCALESRNDARSIEAIAQDSGFRSPSHASRVFHQVFGMTPGSFRRASRGV